MCLSSFSSRLPSSAAFVSQTSARHPERYCSCSRSVLLQPFFYMVRVKLWIICILEVRRSGNWTCLVEVSVGRLWRDFNSSAGSRYQVLLACIVQFKNWWIKQVEAFCCNKKLQNILNIWNCTLILNILQDLWMRCNVANGFISGVHLTMQNKWSCIVFSSHSSKFTLEPIANIIWLTR